MLLDETVRNLRAVFLYLWFRLVSMKPLYDFRAQLVHRLCTARRPETGNGSGRFLCNEPHRAGFFSNGFAGWLQQHRQKCQ